jgi:hypothetical protein
MSETMKKSRGYAPSLQRFELEELAVFTREGAFASNASRDFHLFFVGRDDVHGILKYLLSRVTSSLFLNMYGYSDQELNDECMRCAMDRSITTVITLDKSQSGGRHEKAILDTDLVKDPAAFNAHFVLGQSATHQISHTKGGVLDGRVGFEGSTNWSASGEGTFLLNKQRPGGPGYKAQNNTLAVFTDPATLARFTAELVAEHLVARGAGSRVVVRGGDRSDGRANDRFHERRGAGCPLCPQPRRPPEFGFFGEKRQRSDASLGRGLRGGREDRGRDGGPRAAEPRRAVRGRRGERVARGGDARRARRKGCTLGEVPEGDERARAGRGCILSRPDARQRSRSGGAEARAGSEGAGGGEGAGCLASGVRQAQVTLEPLRLTLRR